MLLKISAQSYVTLLVLSAPRGFIPGMKRNTSYIIFDCMCLLLKYFPCQCLWPNSNFACVLGILGILFAQLDMLLLCICRVLQYYSGISEWNNSLEVLYSTVDLCFSNLKKPGGFLHEGMCTFSETSRIIWLNTVTVGVGSLWMLQTWKGGVNCINATLRSNLKYAWK